MKSKFMFFTYKRFLTLPHGGCVVGVSEREREREKEREREREREKEKEREGERERERERGRELVRQMRGKCL
jgi:hypothetical protein